MTEQIIEITKDACHLAVDRGFMTVSQDGQEIGRVPLDTIAAVIANAHGLTYTNNLIVQLASQNSMMVFCGSNHSPAAYIWSVDGFHQQSGRMEAQVAASQPTIKRLWQQLVKSKIAHQAAVIEALGQPVVPIRALIAEVKSGDPDNIEAQAARRYWPMVFGSDFRRDQGAGGVNALLNYGYMIIRSTVARYIMAAGLHPSFGLHHSNDFNAMRLVDDVMEPFRPYVDFTVYNLKKMGLEEVTPDTKRILAGLPETEMVGRRGSTAMRQCIQNLCISLSQVFTGEAQELDLPEPQPLLWRHQAGQQ
jgi:CRISPR-associated protein Cas1